MFSPVCLYEANGRCFYTAYLISLLTVPFAPHTGQEHGACSVSGRFPGCSVVKEACIEDALLLIVGHP